MKIPNVEEMTVGPGNKVKPPAVFLSKSPYLDKGFWPNADFRN